MKKDLHQRLRETRLFWRVAREVRAALRVQNPTEAEKQFQFDQTECGLLFSEDPMVRGLYSNLLSEIQAPRSNPAGVDAHEPPVATDGLV